MWKSMLALFALATAAVAQCPDQVIVRQAADVRTGAAMGCGGLSLSRGDIKLESKTCPSFVLVTPAHDTTTHREGSGTYTQPSGRVDVTMLDFTCGQDWFLFVPIGSSCKLVGERVVVQLNNYAQYPCNPTSNGTEAR